MVKSSYVLAALSAFFLGTGLAHAAGSDSDMFEIGIEGEDYHYSEPNYADLEGGSFGVNATYTYKWSNQLVFKANVIADFGQLHYSSNGSGSSDDTTLYEQDYRALIGQEFPFGKHNTVLPYLGLGFRMLFDADGDKLTTAGAVGYDRRSEYLYIPLGATFDFKAGDWRIMPNAEFDVLVHGWQTSYLRDIGFDQNLTNDQSSGYGVRGSLMFKPPINFYNLTIGPYVRYWSIGASNQQVLTVGGGIPAGYGQEPDNNTLETGLQATIRF